MEELKTCPLCDGQAKLCHGLPSTQNHGTYQSFVRCKKCGCKTKTFFQATYESKADVDKAAKDSWNHRAAPENKPLTLDELRKMNGNPYWVSEKKNESQDARSLWQQFAYEAPKTGIIAFWEFGYEVENEYKISDYGKTWIAYAHQPEEK